MPKVFQYRVTRERGSKPDAMTRTADVRVTASEQEPGARIVQGQVVDSKEEWYFAQALDKLEVQFIYQFQVFGGRDVRGGQVVDFLCVVPPCSQAVQIYGEYWHRDEIQGNERIYLNALEEYFGRENVHIILAGELKSVETAKAIARRELRL
jgi:hypothetical protein